jgi:hypothetical protein
LDDLDGFAFGGEARSQSICTALGGEGRGNEAVVGDAARFGGGEHDLRIEQFGNFGGRNAAANDGGDAHEGLIGHGGNGDIDGANVFEVLAVWVAVGFVVETSAFAGAFVGILAGIFVGEAEDIGVFAFDRADDCAEKGLDGE